jgi:predicted transcriptional regulator
VSPGAIIASTSLVPDAVFAENATRELGPRRLLVNSGSYSYAYGERGQARRRGEEVKTVQMTLEPELVRAVDRAARKAGTTRSGFTRQALRQALERMEEEELERRHREGYEKKPVQAGEFDTWASEQEWGD